MRKMRSNRSSPVVPVAAEGAMTMAQMMKIMRALQANVEASRIEQVILPVDWDARTLPRQTWIDFCAVLASVLHRDSPQEPAKDRTAPLRPIALRRPSQ